MKTRRAVEHQRSGKYSLLSNPQKCFSLCAFLCPLFWRQEKENPFLSPFFAFGEPPFGSGQTRGRPFTSEIGGYDGLFSALSRKNFLRKGGKRPISAAFPREPKEEEEEECVSPLDSGRSQSITRRRARRDSPSRSFLPRATSGELSLSAIFAVTKYNSDELRFSYKLYLDFLPFPATRVISWPSHTRA